MKIQKYFIKLVQINSPSGTEQEIAEYLKRWLERNEFATQIDSVGNLFASRNVDAKNPAPLLLCAHMDTVQPGIGIQPVLDDGIFTSKGNTILGADNKSSVAAIMVAVENFLNDPQNSKKPLEILFTVKEETGGGIDNFDLKLITAKTVLICDFSKPLGAIVLGAPYIMNFTVKFEGKSAHSSRPDEGINAFAGLADFLNLVTVGLVDNNLTTINIGTVSGGTTINTIPGTCVVHGEVRSFKKELFNKHLDEIESMAQKVARQKKLQLSFSTNGYCPGYLYSENDKPIQLAREVLTKIMGKNPHLERTFGVSDANILVPAGIDAILISDGVKNPHTTDESISVNDLVLLNRIILEFLQSDIL